PHASAPFVPATGLPDATALLQQLKSGSVTVSQLVQQQLNALSEVQSHLNAATAILRDEALRAAAQPLAGERQAGALAGLPCSVKETFGLAGMTVTAGSLRMTPEVHTADAAVVQKLKAAGAIITARSNVPEFAMTGESSNPRYGRTNNPLDPTRVAGGSSGGEGALVGSGASVFGMGSDMLGSIRIPAAFCGIVGFKPASAAVDKTGTWPKVEGFLDSWLCIGPLTRSVRDARLVYDVIARTPTPAPRELSGLRLLRSTRFPFAVQQACIRDALNAAEQHLLAAGLREETPAFADVSALSFQAPLLILRELGDIWRALLSRPGDKFNIWRESWRQWRGTGEIDNGFYRWLIQDATLAQVVKPHSARQTQQLVQRFAQAQRHYQSLLGDDGILLLPTLGMVAPKHGEMNRQTLKPGVNRHVTPLLFCNYCDLPAISIPAWRYRDPASGLPAAVMLVCAPGNEGRLLDVAAALEPVLN
ncbi:MAG TPA: amidase, partial [Permianibacter sp.]|nr:amidase [Permianibacter sp.]